ncbi:hypothetical protein DENIT_12419 [Pseudomonas veronii]|nr:hypothetical protein DENIT_12419 [Pseudomonas veronii]
MRYLDGVVTAHGISLLLAGVVGRFSLLCGSGLVGRGVIRSASESVVGVDDVHGRLLPDRIEESTPGGLVFLEQSP